MSLQLCQVCGKECRPLRCSKCKKAFYCSVNCQQRDWKAGHRQRCGSSSPASQQQQAERALRDLYSTTHGMTIDQIKETQDRANDLVAKQQQQIQERRAEREQTRTIANAKKVVQPPKPAPIASQPSPRIIPNNNVSFMVEEMKYINSFQATLRPATSIPINDENLELVVQPINDSKSMLDFKHKNRSLLQAYFPRQLLPDQCSWRIMDETTIQLRLPFQEPLTDLPVMEHRHSPETINRIACRYCQQILLNSTIQETFLLPKGNWDEIADYLICYSGQPVVDFSSSSEARPGVAMQDSNAVCLHYLDLGNSVCVLAVTGYGEEEDDDDKGNDTSPLVDMDTAATIRGPRSWRDSSGGVTICCSFCSATLGFASPDNPETFRLLQHRLFSDSQPLSSCTSFLAREMVRYAESKAMFTFVVTMVEDQRKKNNNNNKCLLLRLVSWDANLATQLVADESGKLKFEQVAKIVYEEAVDKFSTDINRNEDVTQWIWGGVDLCCLPPQETSSSIPDQPATEPQQSVSTVRLALPKDEYEEVLEDLKLNSNKFCKSVADATILMKMGSTASANLGLTFVNL